MYYEYIIDMNIINHQLFMVFNEKQYKRLLC